VQLADPSVIKNRTTLTSGTLHEAPTGSRVAPTAPEDAEEGPARGPSGRVGSVQPRRELGVLQGSARPICWRTRCSCSDSGLATSCAAAQTSDRGAGTELVAGSMEVSPGGTTSVTWKPRRRRNSDNAWSQVRCGRCGPGSGRGRQLDGSPRPEARLCSCRSTAPGVRPAWPRSDPRPPARRTMPPAASHSPARWCRPAHHPLIAGGGARSVSCCHRAPRRTLDW